MGVTPGHPFVCWWWGGVGGVIPYLQTHRWTSFGNLYSFPLKLPLNFSGKTCLIIFQRIKFRVLSDFYHSIRLSFEITLVILSESRMVFWKVCHRLFIDGSPFYLLLISAGRKLFDVCVSVCLGVNGRRWPWPWLLSLSLFLSLSLSLSRSVDSEPAVSVSGQLLLCTCSWF